MSDSTPTRHHRHRFGIFGGRYVPEPLWTPLEEVDRAHREAVDDEEYRRWEHHLQTSRLGRPTPLTHLEALSSAIGGAQIWAKREDVVEGGTFCTTSALTQALVARRMEKKRLIGESATGDFGVALGIVGTGLGMKVTIFMGRSAIEEEPLNTARMRRRGVDVVAVDGAGRGRSKAMAESLRNYSISWNDAFYATSSLASPAPYPDIVSRGLSVIGRECQQQLDDQNIEVEYVVAPVGSGSFAAGLFAPMLEDGGPQLVGVQAGGEEDSARTAASLVRGRPGVHLGTRSLVLHDEEGQIVTPHADARGLAMPVAGPQHARWLQEGRVHYVMVDDEDAVVAQRRLAHAEGIVASREAAYALAYAVKLAPTLRADQHILAGISGSGVRDLEWEEESEEGGS